MKKHLLLILINNLEGWCQMLRENLQVSRRGEILYQGSHSVWPETELVVEADGRGGALLKQVRGNYPVDYSIDSLRTFENEAEACATAEELSMELFPS